MDDLLRVYLEETEELMQNAETCIIGLESEYTAERINELFRIAHTVKGSSHMAGFEDIGNLMHKTEDMLDAVRNGRLTFGREMAAACFEAVDTVKKLLQSRTEGGMPADPEAARRAADRIAALSAGSEAEKEEEPAAFFPVAAADGERPYKNRFFVTFELEPDLPMAGPVLTMIFNAADCIGRVLWTDASPDCEPGRNPSLLLATDLEEPELYARFDLFYVERIRVVNLNPRPPQTDGFDLQIKGDSPIRVFAPEKSGFVRALRIYAENLNLARVLLLLVDTRHLDIIHEDELAELIEVQKELRAAGAELGFVVDASRTKRIVNIFDSVTPLAELKWYENELQAAADLFARKKTLSRFSEMLRAVCREQCG